MQAARGGPSPGLATLAGVGAIALWASETVLVTFTGDLPPLQIVALAFAAAALLSPLAWGMTGGDPLAAFRQPLGVWLLTVSSLLGYHAFLYYAVQRAPAAPAALLQGCTPLLIIVGSALVLGERLRWWHVLGTAAGFAGVMSLISWDGDPSAPGPDPGFHLALVGLAAALWGVYSLVTRTLPQVPTSAIGVFFAATALAAGLGHLAMETWVTPTATEWAAILGLGILPTGLALYLWDYGIKHGDLQALAASSYGEPLLGAILVALLGRDELGWPMVWAGILIVGGAALAGRSAWSSKQREAPAPGISSPRPVALARCVIPHDFVRVLASHEQELAPAIARASGDGDAGALAAVVAHRWMALMGAAPPPAGDAGAAAAGRRDDAELHHAYAAAFAFTMHLAVRRYWWRPKRMVELASTMNTLLVNELCRPRVGKGAMALEGRFGRVARDLFAAYGEAGRQLQVLRADAERVGRMCAELAVQLNRAAERATEPHRHAALRRRSSELTRLSALMSLVASRSSELASQSADEGERLRESAQHLVELTGAMIGALRRAADATAAPAVPAPSRAGGGLGVATGHGLGCDTPAPGAAVLAPAVATPVPRP